MYVRLTSLVKFTPLKNDKIYKLSTKGLFYSVESFCYVELFEKEVEDIHIRHYTIGVVTVSWRRKEKDLQITLQTQH